MFYIQAESLFLYHENAERQQNLATCGEFYEERSIQKVPIFPKQYCFWIWIPHKLI